MIHRIYRLLKGQPCFEDVFNTPIKFNTQSDFITNERLVEVPFVMSCIPHDAPLKILDFGCTRNWIAFSLASIGHNVWGVDLRDYPFKHPNLVFQRSSILDLDLDDLDLILVLSTLEHVGLGAYGDEPQEDLLNKTVKKLNQLLTEDGQLILTIPVGLPSVDDFERSFTPDEIDQLFSSNGFVRDHASYYKRLSKKNWINCSEREIRDIANDRDARRSSGSGVNGIGCYIFRKSSDGASHDQIG